MAEEHAETSATESESNGHHLGRAAMIAAASGATAYAAKKAFSSRSSTAENGDKSKVKDGDGSASLVTAAVASGWDVAKDSLIPVIEDAAAKAGTFVAERAPDVVRDVVIPRFIAGFERGRKKSETSSAS